MNCESCQSTLIDFEHDELEPQERSRVAQHLATCAQCALESCRLRADLEGIVAAYTEAPSSDARERLRARVERAVSPRWWARLGTALRRPIPVYAAAAAALAPVAVWGALSTRNTTEPPRPAPAPPTITDYDGAATRINAPGVL